MITCPPPGGMFSWRTLMQMPSLGKKKKDSIRRESKNIWMKHARTRNTVVVRGVWTGTEADTGKKLEFH